MLDSIFNLDNPFFKLMSRVADIILLNVLFVISCIPIVTIGAALTSLYYVAINAWKREDGYIFAMYKKSFRDNFKQSTIMWLILAVVGVVLSVDVWFWVTQWKETSNTIYKPLIVVSVVLLVVYVLIFTYVWPLLAKFSNNIKGTLKNSFAMAITHVPETFGVWIIFAAAALSVYMVSFLRVAGILFMFGLVAYLQALLFRHVFKPYLQEEEHITPEEEAEQVGYDNTYADSKMEVAKLAEEMAAKNAAKEARKIAREAEALKEQEEQVAEQPQVKRRSIKDIIEATSNPEEEE